MRTRNTLIVVIILLLLLLVGVMGGFFYLTRAPGNAAKAADDAILIWVRSVYGWGSTAQEQVEKPQDVEFDSAGRMYVTDQMRSRIVVFSATGAYQRTIEMPGDGVGQMQRPVSIAFDEDGLLYVADSQLDKILKMTPQGDFIAEWNDALPLALATADGKIYVACGNHVSIFTSDGGIVDQFGIRGYEPGEVDMPHGIAVDADGRIWVSDAHNMRVQVLEPDGTAVAEYGPGKRPVGSDASSTAAAQTTGTADASVEASTIAMQIPTGIALDGRGNVLLADAFNFNVTAFTTDGELLGTYGVNGGRDGEFYYPTGVSYDPQRRLLAIADTMNSRVQVFEVVLPGDSLILNRVRRYLLSPLCFGPLILLFVLVIVWIALNVFRKRKSRTETVASA